VYRWSKNDVWLHSDVSVSVDSRSALCLGKWCLILRIASQCRVRAARRLVGLNARAASSGRHRVFAGARIEYVAPDAAEGALLRGRCGSRAAKRLGHAKRERR
jgi:hypothetical protein